MVKRMVCCSLLLLSRPARAEEPHIDEAELLRLAEQGEVIEIEDTRPPAVTPGQTVVDREEIDKAAGSRGDAIEFLENLPGVANIATSRSVGPGPLVIRGSAPEDSVYLVDGIEVPQISHFDDFQSVLPNALIEQIEYLPGGFGVEQGRSTGGVVHIKTRAVEPEHARGHLDLSFVNLSGFVQAPVSKAHHLSVAAGFRRSVIDVLLPMFVDEEDGVSFAVPPQYYDAQLRLDWRPTSKHRVSLLGFGSFDRATVASDTLAEADPVTGGSVSGKSAFGRSGLTWVFEDSKVRNQLTLSGGRQDLDYALGERFARLREDDLTVRNDARFELAPWLTVAAGGDLRGARRVYDVYYIAPPAEGSGGETSWTLDPVLSIVGRQKEVRAAGYTALELRPFRRWLLTPGLRVDHFSFIDSTTWSPRLSSELDLGGGFAVRGSVGLYTRPLSVAEGAVANLDPERARHYVAGLGWKHLPYLNVSVTGFLTDRRDLVVLEPPTMDGQNPLELYRNAGTGRTIGNELFIQTRAAGFQAWLSYTLSRSTRTDGPGMPTRLFDHDQTHNLTALAGYSLGAWSFGARFRLASGEPMTPIEGAVYVADKNAYRPTYGEINSERSELAHQLDLRVDRFWQWNSLKLSAYLDVTNVYAHARTIGYSYNFDYTRREPQTDVPLLPSIGLRGEFQ